MDGFFFDEAPGDYNQINSDYMRTAFQYVKSLSDLGPGVQQVITNPGVLVDARFYRWADKINVFEDYFSAYSPITLSKISASYRAQSTIMIHNFTGSLGDQKGIVRTLATQGGIAGVFISDGKDYDVASSVWNQFCCEMMSA